MLNKGFAVGPCVMNLGMEMAADTSSDIGWGPLPAPAEVVFEGKDVENYLSEVTRGFMQDIDGARRGISWAATFFRHGEARTIAASSPLARDADQEQCSFAEGPVLEAVATGEFVLVSDLRRDRRWPGYASAAASHGVHSLLSMPIVSSDGSSAAINLYSPFAHAFTSDDVVRTISYAREVGRALRVVVRVAERAEATAELAVAQNSLALVDLALRSLMREYGLSADGALQYLRTAAAHTNVALRDVALNVVVPVEGQEGHAPAAPESPEIRELNPAAIPPGNEDPSRTERTG